MQNFLASVQKLGFRGLAYAILSLIIEKDSIVVIVPDKTDKELISILLDDIRSRYELRSSPTSDIKLANFEVITRDEYFKHWKKYAGKRLIFVAEDKNIICPALDYIEKIIEETMLSKPRDPLRIIVIRIGDILSPLDVAKEYYMEYKQGRIDAKKFHSLIKSRLPKKEDASLALELLKIFYG